MKYPIHYDALYNPQYPNIFSFLDLCLLQQTLQLSNESQNVQINHLLPRIIVNQLPVISKMLYSFKLSSFTVLRAWIAKTFNVNNPIHWLHSFVFVICSEKYQEHQKTCLQFQILLRFQGGFLFPNFDRTNDYGCSGEGCIKCQLTQLFFGAKLAKQKRVFRS